uniref:Protein NO VEIN C-terminal domain-containing protein n=1 Tax=Rhodopseudomonas palustris (strain BisA53) TaxID=316055 RepID=Q07NQ7_RHOP5
MALEGIDASKEGTDWTADEVAVLVGSYFLMLAEERAGRDYNKSEYRRSVIAAIGRKPGSIERKLQNVSAVLDEIGVPWIQGYKPLPHYQDALVAVVEQQLLLHPELFMDAAAGPLRIPNEDGILVAAPAFLNSDPESRPAAIRRLVGKFDPAARDACNRDLGKAGEEFVVGFERRRLERAGRDDLAREVRWVSDLDGDGYGYDVKSFETDGQQRLLEIKTTCGNERTPFWMTRRECDVAAEQGDMYRIRRVFHFRNEVKMFDIVPPLDAALRLTPTAFMAAPR